MNEAKIKDELEVLADTDIQQKLNEKNYAQLRDILSFMINDYNRIMADQSLKTFVLRNRALAIRARATLERTQNYMIDYCNRIRVIPPQRIELMPIPEASQEKQKNAVNTWNHVATLVPAFKATQELYEAVIQGYKPPEQAKYRLNDWLDMFNTNAEQLINTLEDPELEELKQQNKDKITAAIKVLKTVMFWIDELIKNKVTCSGDKLNKFIELQEKLAA